MKRALFTLVIFLIFSIVGCDSMSNKTSDNSASPELSSQATDDAVSAKKRSGAKSAKDSTSSRERLLVNQSSTYGQKIFETSGSVSPGGSFQEILYENPGFYKSGYTYTAVLTPESGDPDLHLYQQDPFAKLKESENFDLETDMIQFTIADFQSSPSEIQLDAIGRGDGVDSDYTFKLYEKGPSSGFSLQFPLNNYNESTAPVSAMLDLYNRDQGHPQNGYNRIDLRNGQTGKYQYGCLSDGQVSCTSSNEDSPWAYKREFGQAWSTPWVNYDDDVSSSGQTWMWYDNHTGYDYAVVSGTPVYAMAGGTLVSGLQGQGYNQVVIEHTVGNNKFRTYYLHLSSRDVYSGSVNKGQKIGESGQYCSGCDVGPHLHVTVRQLLNGEWVLIDPYGEPGIYGSLWE